MWHLDPHPELQWAGEVSIMAGPRQSWGRTQKQDPQPSREGRAVLSSFPAFGNKKQRRLFFFCFFLFEWGKKSP